MSLIKWSPLNNWYNPAREIDEIFKDLFNSFSQERNENQEWSPRVDIAEDDHRFIFNLELPGVNKDDVKVQYTDGLLQISGEKKALTEKENMKYHRCERTFGKFERDFRFKTEILSDKIEASFSNGVLTLEVPKAEIVQTKTIDVKVK